jgi:hypothetical protein
MGTLIGASMQAKRWPLICADGTVSAGGTAQLVLPKVPARSLLLLQNLSTGILSFEFGSARATATISGGVVTGFTVTNAGFNFTKAPVVRLIGGGKADNGSYLGLGQPGGAAPDSTLGVGRPAKAHCVMTGTAPNLSVASITVDDPGAGYIIAPYVDIINSDLDPYGCAVPSATVGLVLAANSLPFLIDGTSCHNDSISVFGGTTGQAFVCRWMQ